MLTLLDNQNNAILQIANSANLSSFNIAFVFFSTSLTLPLSFLFVSLTSLSLSSLRLPHSFSISPYTLIRPYFPPFPPLTIKFSEFLIITNSQRNDLFFAVFTTRICSGFIFVSFYFWLAFVLISVKKKIFFSCEILMRHSRNSWGG